MSTVGKPGKVATRGQKQIYEENCQTMKTYTSFSVSSAVIYFVFSFGLLSTSSWAWVGFGFCVVLQCIAIYTMHSMSRSRRNERGQVVDAGTDLNQPEAFGEYCKDIVILTSFVLIVALLWAPIFWLLLVIPGYAFYKLWTGLLAPWIFAQPEEEEEDDKKSKKKERKLRRI